MKKRLIICYHGTSQECAREILKKGFKKYTYFAKHLEDALEFGGNFVFEAAFKESEVAPLGWQFKIETKKSQKEIVRLRKYPDYIGIFENKKLGKRVFESNLPK